MREVLCEEHETLGFLVTSQYEKMFGRPLIFIHSVRGGFLYSDSQNVVVTCEMAQSMQARITRILESDLAIEFVSHPREKLIGLFREKGRDDKVAALKAWTSPMVSCICYDECIDYIYETHSISKARLRMFELRECRGRLLLRFPDLTSPNAVCEWSEPKILEKIIEQHLETRRICGISTLADLNRAVFEKRIQEVINISENLHIKRIFEIADNLSARFPEIRIVSIAGASSSNKTTFAIRLAQALLAHGHKSIIIGMDDFFIGESDGPIGEWESPQALNLPLMGQRLSQLLDGQMIPRRRFDFAAGEGYDDLKEKMILGNDDFLIIEGIHGLNPSVLEIFRERKVARICLQATSPINIDLNNRFPASDLRLVRRMVRDFYFRETHPRETLLRWSDVREGEMKYIFPYQEDCDYFFNSAMVYELAVLAPLVRGLCGEASIVIAGEEGDGAVTTNEALRISQMLSLFSYVSLEMVPKNSCLREFVGGSCLDY